MINETRVRRIGLRVKKPHPLVAAARDKMERGWQRNGVLECWPLGIDVSREGATRALTLTDRLIKALEADGIIVDSEVSLGRHYTTARVDGYTYRLKLVEDFRREKKPEGEEDYWDHDARVCDYRRWRSHSTGRIQLRLTKKDYYHGVIESWQDSKACKLEQSIDAIVSRLHTLAAEQRLCDEHREKVWREEQEQEAARARARADEEHRRLVEQRQRDETQQRVLALYEEAASGDALTNSDPTLRP